MGLRHRSIRLRVGILILVPVLCLIALYGFVTSITLGNALSQAHARSLQDQLLTPITAFQNQLDNEQRLAVLSLTSPSSTRMAYDLSGQEASTQGALSNMKTALQAPAVQGIASPRERQLISSLLSDTGKLSFIRTDVDASALTVPQTLSQYGGLINQAYLVLQAAMYQQSSVPLATQSLDVIGLDQVAQTTLQEGDLLTADIAGSKFPSADKLFFAQLAGIRSSELADTLPLLDPAYRKLVDGTVTTTLSAGLSNLEAAVIASPWARRSAPAQLVAGQGIFQTYSAALDKAISSAGADLQSQSQRTADDIFWQLILAAGLGLLGTVASIALSLYIGRGLVRQLRNLRVSALGLANQKLPEVIKQLRAGEAVDLSEYAAPEETKTRDEIEQVQNAFNIAAQSAVQSAVDEARLRRGISDVFRNLAGRSQSLLHRQLTLIDGMERRATEPEELEDLFRIDHLTTRMRRHAEGLIILSGETPARGWRQPVPLIDVLRAAVAEVEDYTRVRVLSRTRAAVTGRAVADVIHLIAELAENATVFSPPNTPVRIQGDLVGRGLAIEIEDRGLGISSDRLAEINADLADPPQFDLSDSDRLGLFIAGQLAHRHDISVRLQPSVYGGTIAVVLIPTALVVAEDSFVTDPVLTAGGPAGELPPHPAALTGVERGRLLTGNGHLPGLDEPAPVELPPGTGGKDSQSGTVITGTSVGEPLPRRRPVQERAVIQLSATKAADASQEDADAGVTTTELAELGLPTRVRQANLAPQLRNSTPARTVVPQPAADTSSSPEEARSTMSALQRGWQLGRAEAGAHPPDSPADPPRSDYDVFARDRRGQEPPGTDVEDADEQGTEES
jgi:anti-sigma regulatory factor (Ser/Thr protein kinase)